ncbi:MAG: efflux RND transporter permease subunit [Lentisphaeria bacterium]
MKKFGIKLARFSLERPKSIAALIFIPTLVLMLLAGLPSVWPDIFQGLNSVKVDTDPENMLSKEATVRVFNDDMKELFDLNDMVVVGIVNSEHPEGVFNPESLQNIYALSQFAEGLTWPHPEHPDDPGKRIGVIAADIIAPSTVDNIETGGLGVVKFEWLMPQPPATQEEAVAIRKKAQDIPFLDGTLVSEDGQAICLYLPLTSKDLSNRVYEELKTKIAELSGNDKFYITGLPVAEDTFGHQMFVQMGISAPLAMLAIFLLMLFFFRKLSLILSPLIVAMVSVIFTMSLLVITGQTIHIMSSMIPIFIMPIAVLDSVHILSMFFDRYQQNQDRRATMVDVMDALFMPMLYTSLTSAAGFASLALTPIPPVQVFGIFCSIGIMTAWILTIIFIPAYVTFLPEKWLKNFGARRTESTGFLSRILEAVGEKTYSHARTILAGTIIIVGVAIYGITQIRINDNPIKWFEPEHPIRVADRVLNNHFGGTYMAYLALEAPTGKAAGGKYAAELRDKLDKKLSETGPDNLRKTVYTTLRQQLKNMDVSKLSAKELLKRLNETARAHADKAEGDDLYYAWDDASLFLEKQIQRFELFKRPEVLRYMTRIQESLAQVKDQNGKVIVGKSNSLADIVETVHRELRGGQDKYFTIPDSSEAVAQCLMQYQSSHRPQDLWHFTSSNYRNSAIWFQLRSGDNIKMEQVAEALRTFTDKNPPPEGITANWFGLTYINVVWQDKMVAGMMFAFLGSFLVVFLMMTLLFRSALWGILCMLPLTVTIAFIYGAIGLVGKDYDMPVAVLSALALGLAVDFAIHFLEHSRVLRYENGDWKKAIPHVFGDPSRAIVRNIIVIAVGFLPLLAAPLVPYQTVGVFLAAILAVSGLATLLLLPALVRLLERFLFPESRICCVSCNCITCLAASVSLVVLVLVNVKQFMDIGWTPLSWISLLLIPILALICRFLSKREKCELERNQQKTARKDANNE